MLLIDYLIFCLILLVISLILVKFIDGKVDVAGLIILLFLCAIPLVNIGLVVYLIWELASKKKILSRKIF